MTIVLRKNLNFSFIILTKTKIIMNLKIEALDKGGRPRPKPDDDPGDKDD